MRTTILKEIRQSVKPAAQPVHFIDAQLEPYGDALQVIRSATYRSTHGAAEINEYVRWLNRLDNTDWVPPAILALVRHRSEPAWLVAFFRQLERLAVGLLALRSGVNDRLERYGTVLAALEDGKDPLAPGAALDLTVEERSRAGSSGFPVGG